MNKNMNVKNIVSSLFVLVVVLGVAVAVNYVHAGPTDNTYTNPSSTFPSCPTSVGGCNTPVNVGTAPQIKNGDLSVNAFIAEMNSEFVQDLTADELATPGASARYACVDQNGKFIKCEGPVGVSASYFQKLDVTGIPGFTASGVTATTVYGTHTGSTYTDPLTNQSVMSPTFTGQIKITYTETSTPTNSQIIFYKNGQVPVVGFPQCWNITSSSQSPQTFTVASDTYNTLDAIDIASVVGNSVAGCQNAQ
jgi:hypothetical protein